MFNLFPFKFREISKYFLVSNDAGDFFFCNKKNLDNLLFNNISKDYENFLKSKGFIYDQENDLFWNNHKFKINAFNK